VRITSDPNAREIAGRALPEGALTEKLIGVFYDTYNETGYGLLERAYAAAMAILLAERGFRVRREVPFTLRFHGHDIGTYRADMIVEDRVILEIKTGAVIPPGTREQLTNYLRISRIQVGLILLFGPEPRFKRVVMSRARSDQI
jgi:GxxExxY protein